MGQIFNMIDHKQNREKIIRDLKLNLIGPSPCGKPIKIHEMQIFESYKEMYLPYRQFDSELSNNEGDEILNNRKPSERYGLGVLYPSFWKRLPAPTIGNISAPDCFGGSCLLRIELNVLPLNHLRQLQKSWYFIL